MSEARRRAESPLGTALAYALAALSGLAIAWVDQRTDEVVVSIVPLAFGGALLGLARPTHPWRWGLLVGMWIPLASWTGWLGPAKDPPSSPFAPLIALIPPTVAAYAASWLERR